MAWRLGGQLVESCSCNMFCPCWFGVQDLMIMDQGWCAGVIAFRIDEGEADGVDLGDRQVIVSVDFPGPTMYDGNATARVWLDDGTSEEQREQLEAIFQGRKGGPMEAISGLVSTWLPTQTASIERRDEDETITVSVGDAGEVRSTLLRDPEGNPFTLRGGGFVTGFGYEELELAPSGTRWSDADTPREFETKSGARGMVAWSG